MMAGFIEIFVLLLLLVANGVFSMTEMAVVTSRKEGAAEGVRPLIVRKHPLN